MPRGCDADAIDPKSRSRGTGDRTSIPASRQWAGIHIARFGESAGGGTDPRAGIGAVDPINSARRRRSKPRTPSARAARRAEIYARASSFEPKEEYGRAPSFGPKEEYARASSFGPKEQSTHTSSFGRSIGNFRETTELFSRSEKKAAMTMPWGVVCCWLLLWGGAAGH